MITRKPLGALALGALLAAAGAARQQQQSGQPAVQTQATQPAQTQSAQPAKPQQPAAPKTHLKVGDVAPDFALRDAKGTEVKLSDFRGKKNVVLAFYVLAFTGG